MVDLRVSQYLRSKHPAVCFFILRVPSALSRGSLRRGLFRPLQVVGLDDGSRLPGLSRPSRTFRSTWWMPRRCSFSRNGSSCLVWPNSSRIVVSTSTKVERNALLVLMTFYFGRQGFSNVIEPTTCNYLLKEHHVFLLE